MSSRARAPPLVLTRGGLLELRAGLGSASAHAHTNRSTSCVFVKGAHKITGNNMTNKYCILLFFLS